MTAAVTAAALVLLSSRALVGAAAGRRRRQAVARLARPSATGPGRGVRRVTVLRPPSWLAPRLAQAAVPFDAGAVWTAWWVAGAAAAAVGLTAAGAGAALLGAGVAGGVPVLAWRLLRHRGDAAFERALAPAVERVAGALRSGASLRQALGETAGLCDGDLGADLGAVVAAVEHGAGVVPALEAWAERRPSAGVRLVVAALCLGAETGGATALTVDNLALTLRQRLGADAEARALATQARASAAVLVAAPLVFCALSVVTDARAAAFLLRTPPGLVLLAAGLFLDAAGALWMARLTRPAGAPAAWRP